MHNDLSGMSPDALVKILDETQEQIVEIRAELQRRKEQEQHAAIDRLELSAVHTGIEWRQVKAFFVQVLEELRREGKPK